MFTFWREVYSAHSQYNPLFWLVVLWQNYADADLEQGEFKPSRKDIGR